MVPISVFNRFRPLSRPVLLLLPLLLGASVCRQAWSADRRENRSSTARHFLSVHVPPGVLSPDILTSLRSALEKDFWSPEKQLYASFHENGAKQGTDRGFFDYPRTLPMQGDQPVALFNAWMGDAVLARYRKSHDPSLRARAETIKAKLVAGFQNDPPSPLSLFDTPRSIHTLLNDAAVGCFLTDLFVETGALAYRDQAIAVLSNLPRYREGRRWRTWWIGTGREGEVSPRESWAVGCLAYAGWVLGRPDVMETAESLALSILDLPANSPVLKKIPRTAGTDAELGMGLLALADLRPAKRWSREIARLAKAWLHRPLSASVDAKPTEATGTVDLAEQIQFFLLLHEKHPREVGNPDRARRLARELEACFSGTYRAFPIACGRNTFYLAFNSLILTLYEQLPEP